ncbi:hypothetical protein M885DRAFT_590758 [Pelagophyceae sp. CCMP2097]|nr:hypothetical protein M885DRAFT_590758 [Pelagophyceae sp. CCMP2097]
MRLRRLLLALYAGSLVARGLQVPVSAPAALSQCEAAAVAAAERGDVPAALAFAAGVASAPAWSAILARLAADASPALLRCAEQMYETGLSITDLDARANDATRGRLPPELPAGCIGGGAAKILGAPPPMLWCDGAAGTRAVAEVDCAGRDASFVRKTLDAARSRREPVVLRNVGVAWRALVTWDADFLAAALPRAMCRVAESRGVAFCRESHADVRAGVLLAPSKLVSLSGADFLRALRGGTLVDAGECLFPGGALTWYAQANTPQTLRGDVDLEALGLAAGQPDSRIWACAAGTFSPTHYDETDSVLVQIRARKRLLLWPRATSLGTLRPHAPGTALARRAAVDVSDSAHAAALPPSDVARVVADAREARLEASDAIWFPAEWAHFTEALAAADGDAFSVSLSLRE